MTDTVVVITGARGGARKGARDRVVGYFLGEDP